MNQQQFDAWLDREMLDRLRPLLPPGTEARVEELTVKVIRTVSYIAYNRGKIDGAEATGQASLEVLRAMRVGAVPRRATSEPAGGETP